MKLSAAARLAWQIAAAEAAMARHPQIEREHQVVFVIFPVLRNTMVAWVCA